MSMSQFNRWLRDHGVERTPRGYRVVPATETAVVEPGAASNGAERRLSVTVVTRTRDRHGDILEPGGARIADFLKNPVVLWAHEVRSLPIGRVTSLARREETLRAEILFAPTPFAEEVYRLYAGGFLRGWSVGFRPVEWEVMNDESGKFAGYHIRAWELIELSAVPIPANPDALTDALEKGLVREPALVQSLRDAAQPTATVEVAGRPRSASAPAAPRSEVAERDAGADVPRARDQRDGAYSPDIALPILASALAAKLLVRLRPSLGHAVGSEIRRRMGRLD